MIKNNRINFFRTLFLFPFFNLLRKLEICLKNLFHCISVYNMYFLRLNQMLWILFCLSYHSNTEVVLFACLSSAGPPQRADCLTLRWRIASSVFPRDTATHYRTESRSKVLQPFDFDNFNEPYTLRAVCTNMDQS